MQGIDSIYGDEEHIGFVHRQLRGLLLMLITVTPILAAGILDVFGRPLRHWLTEQFGKNLPIHGLWLFFFPLIAMLLAMLALTVIHWAARPEGRKSNRTFCRGRSSPPRCGGWSTRALVFT
jgi:uncharacterized BrkB/YihY/UPF0761 family membrane protein